MALSGRRKRPGELIDYVVRSARERKTDPKMALRYYLLGLSHATFYTPSEISTIIATGRRVLESL
jgi:hypothetical protein